MELVAYSTAAVTLGLVVARPRLTPGFRVTPVIAAAIGVAVMMLMGVVSWRHLGAASRNLWTPFVAIAAIMVMTEVAARVGLLELWANRIDRVASSPKQLFTLVFGLGILTSASLNNDAAILLLTPLVVALVRRRFPERRDLLVPFAFAVFISAGVAPMPVSNPMNMVVAEFSGISFNEYTVRMAPLAVACWVIGFVVLRWVFARPLSDASGDRGDDERLPVTGGQRQVVALLAAVLVSYPIVGYLGGPAWAVAACGAAAALMVAGRAGERVASVFFGGVSWGTLGFLLGVLIMSMGLFEVGLADRLTGLYDGSGVWTIGGVSAVGSAVLNNHPMSHLNMLALESVGAGDLGVFAALVGGDLGPRLLPMGSLAGLLWIELLRRRGVNISVLTFMAVGAVITLPALVASLALLSAY